MPRTPSLPSPHTRRARSLQGRAPLGELAGCPFHDLRLKFAGAGLRPTRQRMSLGWLLFSKGSRHLTAEGLQEEAYDARVSISLATIYNSLHQFTETGLLREIAVDGTRTWFDTNVARHDHFFADGRLIDIPAASIGPADLPQPPAGKRIARIDVIVRLCDEASP